MTQKRLLALVLMVLGMVPSLTFAVDGKAFCVENYGNGAYGLSQVDVAQGAAVPSGCYVDWYDESGSGNDVYTALTTALDDGNEPFKMLTIASDLVFAGYDASTGKCAESFKPIDILCANCADGDSIVVDVGMDAVSGENSVIKNFCFSDWPESSGNYGFFGRLNKVHVSNMSFEDAYVEVKQVPNSNFFVAYDGVLAGSIEKSIVEKVSVKNSHVLGNNAGGLAGMVANGSVIKGFEGSVLNVSHDLDEDVMTENTVNIGGIVGVLGSSHIERSSVVFLEVNSMVPTTSLNKVNMGGFAGSVSVWPSDDEEPISDSYVLGVFYGDENVNNVGFVAGNLSSDPKMMLTHSVYYVQKTDNVGLDPLDPNAFGALVVDGETISADAIEKINEDNDFEVGGEKVVAGVFKEDVYKTFWSLGDNFAVQLNLTLSDDENFKSSSIWTRHDDINDGYPFIADYVNYFANQMVLFVIPDAVHSKISSSLQQQVDGYVKKTGENWIHMYYTNYEGKVLPTLGDDWESLYNDLKSKGFTWQKKNTRNDFSASTIYYNTEIYTLEAPVNPPDPIKYSVTFDLNLDKESPENIFFSDVSDKKLKITQDIYDDGTELLPDVDDFGVYRLDSAMECSWMPKSVGSDFRISSEDEMFDYSETDGFFNQLDVSNNAFTVYAHWVAAKSQKFETATIKLALENCDDCKVKLVQEDAEGNRYEHPFVSEGTDMVVKIPKPLNGNITFVFKVEADETDEYKLVGTEPFDLWGSDGSHLAGPIEKIGDLFVESAFVDGGELIVRYQKKPLKLAFDENTKDSVFYGDSWVESGSFGEGSVLPRVYKVGSCFNGWSLKKDGSGEIYTDVNGLYDDNVNNATLYAAWSDTDENGNPCEGKTITAKSDGDGSISLSLSLNDGTKKKYPLEPISGEKNVYSITVPGFTSMDDFLVFNIEPEPRDGFVLLRANWNGNDLSDKLHFYYSGEDVDLELFFVKDEEEAFAFDYGLEKTAITEFVYFAGARENFNYSTDDSLYLREYLPRIYDAENQKYIWSWSFNGIEDYLSFTSNLYDASSDYRKNNEAIELVANWENGLPTNTSFEITGEKFENGSVNLVQVYNGQEIRHDMNEARISLPQLDEKLVYAFKVEAAPADGFMLNKPVEVFVEVPNDTSFTLKLNDGDLLVLSSLGRDVSKRIRINAEFAPVIEIAGGFREITEVELALSGDAVRFSVPSNVFSKGASARVTMQLMDALGNVIADTLLYEGKEPPEVIDWERFPLSVGRYAFKAVIENGDDKIDFNRDFVVKNELATESCDDCWHMVGLSNVKLKSVDWSDAEFYWWDESRNFGRYWQYQEFLKNESPVEGRGYWFNTEKEQTLVLKDSVPRPEDFVWVLDSVYSGWNMVSNPYSWYIDAYALYMVEEGGAANKADTADVKFWRWDAKAGAYEPVQYLAPHEAVWARVSRKVKWEIPEMPCYVTILDEDGNLVPAPGLKSSVSLFKASNAKDSFTLRAVLADSKGRVDRWNTIGVGDQAVMAEEPPQGMGDFVNLSVVDGKKALATSLKKHSDAGSYEWNMELKAADIRMGYLSFEGVDELKAKGLSLYVTVDGETTEVQEGKALNVTVGKDAKKANVYVAASPRKVASATLQGLKAVQVGRMLQVNFVADASLAGGMTRVELVSLQGRVMAAASAKTLAGSNSLNLDVPKSGVYMLRVKAGNRSAVGRISVK